MKFNTIDLIFVALKLCRKPGGCTTSKLMRATGISRPTAYKVFDGLERNKMVTNDTTGKPPIEKRYVAVPEPW